MFDIPSPSCIINCGHDHDRAEISGETRHEKDCVFEKGAGNGDRGWTVSGETQNGDSRLYFVTRKQHGAYRQPVPCRFPMSKAPFFTTRKRPVVRENEAEFKRWLAREMAQRKEAVLDITKRDTVWVEILTLATMRHGRKLNIEELRSLWSQEIEELNSKSSQKCNDDPRSDDSIKSLCDVHEDGMEGEPQRKRNTNLVCEQLLPGRTMLPPGAYRLIVKEVLRRASVLTSKSNSKSRTRQANQARSIAWQEIREIILEKCGKAISAEQVQIIWRHQKQKVPEEVIEEAVVNPGSVDDKRVNALFHNCEDSRPGKKDNLHPHVALQDTWKNIKVDTEERPLPSPLTVQTAPFLATNGLLLPCGYNNPANVPLFLTPTHSYMSAVDQDRKTQTMETLMAAQIHYLNQMADLQRRQAQVMDTFTQTLQRLME